MKPKVWKKQDIVDIVETHLADDSLRSVAYGQIMWRYPDGKFTYANLWDIICETQNK